MDIEGKKRGRRRRDVIWSDISCFSTDFFSSISSLVCQGSELLCERKKRALAVFFVMLEIISLVLDVFGQNRRSILLAEILLSVFGFVMTILSCMLERTRVHAEKQLGVVEICFSVVQLIATFLPVLGFKINNNFEAPVLLLAFAIINAVFTFIKDENILGALSLTNEYENKLQLLEPMLHALTNLREMTLQLSEIRILRLEVIPQIGKAFQRILRSTTILMQSFVDPEEYCG
ncbi:hypothetical protein Patl1_22207 [Pistacia atlantica]|uniref:Uncharacterized protein n=1 Tax=Pistacia atlantica TaxID=434234 RepID=A0ACC1BH87_9ROSI|nr:hypothetical protein Patl1_22207 [Pistacia atlantica]